ncbi:hypothetical protein HELRODRAFT_63211, partial [Helobdella robusta]|uniref:Pseudouridylate synthase 7 homolog n=1 Tax=Helobdella robusta TaxID=6412 RepID=T1FXC4_HELRO
RYSDFIVHEINLDGNVVHLTNISFKEDAEVDEDGACLFTEEQLDVLKRLSGSPKESTEKFIVQVKDDKEVRTKMHNYIRNHFPKLSSETTSMNNEKNIIVTVGGNKRDNSKNHFRDYCKFVLYKENKSTMEAIQYISTILRVNHSLFSFAGTKDKRAITTQEVTAYGVHPRKLAGLNKCLKNVTLGDFRTSKTPLKLGDLKGNHFEIIIRNLDGANVCIENSLSMLKRNGFINYFGMQRFGATEVCNSRVGKCLIQSDWITAIELILKPRNEENDLIMECRKTWHETHDPSKALQALKNFSCIERKLLEGLCRHTPKNSVAALSYIPRNMRLMYLHAYQSLIWNKIVSKRFQTLKSEVLIGDLFQSSDDKSVSVVSEENIGYVKLTDVVLPLPGFDVKYPDNEIKIWYDELLSSDGLHVNSFNHKIRDYSLSGSYRKIIVIPDVCNWRILNYQNAENSLIITDKDVMEGFSSSVENEGVNKALKLELSLPASSYATMAIREITKQDTSSANQTLLTRNLDEFNK